ncbi:MAG: hypothetical protein HFG54_03960 [Lachnospiraceae bacterium]|jgi:hypothetical protein|nr:hypothetical protein [Lachnospiraceae bacterium]
MRRNQGIYLLFWISVGLMLATIGANRVFASGLVDYQVLYQYVLEGWQNTATGDWKCVFRILAVRIFQTAMVEALCRSRLHKVAIPLLLAWVGCAAGLSLVLMTWYRGIFGLIVFLISVFPHQIFYGTAWGILIFKCLSGYETRKGRFWGAVAALILFGILLEIHVNARLLSFLF